MKSTLAMHMSPRCTARSKRTGQGCRAPAVRGCAVCRFHGAGGGGPAGRRNGNYRHGRYTKEALADRRVMADLIEESRRLMVSLSCEETE